MVGFAAKIRVVSLPFYCRLGTLKSTRISAFLF